MTQYSELKSALQPHLNWHGARLSFLTLFLLALFKVKTVNLSELALGFEGSAQSDSKYKRLQRFFRGFDLEYATIAKLVIDWMQTPQPWVLSIDRTTWEFGTHCFNILSIGVVHEGVAFPLLWWMLQKKGNSSSDERMRFVEALLHICPDLQIRYLCGDREFIGQLWVRYLRLAPLLPFRLRIRATDKIERQGKALQTKVVFAHLQVGQRQRLKGDCRVWGQPVAVEGLRLEDGALLVVIGPTQDDQLIDDYALRWGIETLFGIFKTRGFCLESTHFTEAERLRKLFALLTLALYWAMKTGLFLHQLKPIALKTHERRAKSLFRLGFDHFRQMILNPSPGNEREFLQSLQLLSST
ncbi:IS4-like element ISAcma48 family transposase [Acaryochloris marina]|uniref:Transposase IS4-like domain-containing protein n=1 Tax=Acaryochloris marina (strain MBIC 11017) TaxID=329726 RepID=A8ZMH5_ACAM1|nr:IS4-like element ISAcma48 family transposase [Acaryochloris marina]ABW32386.1 conserved hypothetical protein [Acaryochloris marina MBIC11017]